MSCPKCGRENPLTAHFCVFCGAALAAGTPPASPPPSPAYGAGPSSAAHPTYPTAMPAYVPPPPFPAFLMEIPSPWRERYAMAHSLIRTGNLVRILGLVLGGALSLFLMIPIFALASEAGRWGAGSDVAGGVLYLVMGVLIWGGTIALGLFALGTLVRASGYQLAALLNLEVRNAPEESLPNEQKARILSAAVRLGQA